ncbi:hypothetical protein, conserved [Trypanosoma brucei gambiense DAL972]|uniref:Soluble N-ethylmaleimide sensitive factor (NSF) attachment protein n=1 Tax=Trypanosoma brucei gambiense (strain MHOM/CI/86/DAL972) TaxID=679716 RepID=D0AAI1_TRYB9|nr:hypothetical protein, conserved [Trypanosoma brucei gambiense DAL972]CBH18682.1 hypothetical protein, conserved [Trypanosoma brucei gambiense DAL972]|eukprot:XP_011780946.1 hypothetical protein, conserved [Trypanosoma brucei gambiense DAL972]
MSKTPEQLVAEAEKLLHKGWLSFLGSGSNYEKAHEKLVSAGTQYKAAGDFANAARVFERAAELCKKDKNEVDFIVDLEEAARCHAKAGDVKAATRLYEQIVDTYDRKRQNVKAAKACLSLSELLGSDERAVEWLDRATKYYEAQGSHTMAADVLKSMAEQMIKGGNYEGALMMYDRLARKALDDRAARLGARNLFFMALLSQLSTLTSENVSVGVESVRERFTEYQELDPQFNEYTREHMLITAIIEAMECESPEKLKEAIDDYSTVCTVNDIKEQIFARAVKLLEGRSESIM